RIDDVARLVGDRLQRRADEMLAARAAGKTGDETAHIRTPVGRAEPCERGHEIDAAVVVDGARERLALRRVREQSESVAQPLDRGPGHEDGALERVLALPCCGSREDPV